MKRVLLFIATNLAVVAVLGVALNLLLPLFGVSTDGTGGLLLFALLFGMGGAFISLLMSKRVALMSTGARVIDTPATAAERWLLATVERQARDAGIGMPDVAVYDSPEINAFATGAKRDQALVAVSTGLLRNMRQDEVEAVLAHEVSHVANGDMVTLTLIQGVVNTFVIFLARVVGGVIDSALRGSDDEHQGYGLAYFAIVMVLELIFGLAASMIVAWFSRQREFRADAGGARLAGRGKMIAALARLRQHAEPSHLPDQLAAFGIRGKGGLAALFASHPPLEQRIAALGGLDQPGRDTAQRGWR